MLSSMYRVARYHLGSIVFGSLLIAIIQVPPSVKYCCVLGSAHATRGCHERPTCPGVYMLNEYGFYLDLCMLLLLLLLEGGFCTYTCT